MKTLERTAEFEKRCKEIRQWEDAAWKKEDTGLALFWAKCADDLGKRVSAHAEEIELAEAVVALQATIAGLVTRLDTIEKRADEAGKERGGTT